MTVPVRDSIEEDHKHTYRLLGLIVDPDDRLTSGLPDWYRKRISGLAAALRLPDRLDGTDSRLINLGPRPDAKLVDELEVARAVKKLFKDV